MATLERVHLFLRALRLLEAGRRHQRQRDGAWEAVVCGDVFAGDGTAEVDTAVRQTDALVLLQAPQPVEVWHAR
jgi:hypothetical protein